MTSAQFWTLISRLGGVPDPDRADALAADLATADPARIVAFADDLAQALHRLDTPAHMAQDVRDVGESETDPAIPLSADAFLHARLAVVAAGQQVWQRVADDPVALGGRWHLRDGEHLLGIAPLAWERATGRDWNHETAVSVETGTNTDAWGDAAGVERLPRRRWLSCGPGFDAPVPARPVYDSAWSMLTQAIAADETWTAWWAGAGVPELHLNPVYTLRPAERPRVRKGRNSVRVECSLDGSGLRAGDRSALPTLAAEHLRTVLDLAGQRLALPALPALPPTPEVPDTVPDAYAGPPEGPDEIIRTLVEQMGLSVEEARAIVVGGGG